MPRMFKKHASGIPKLISRSALPVALSGCFFCAKNVLKNAHPARLKQGTSWLDRRQREWRKSRKKHKHEDLRWEAHVATHGITGRGQGQNLVTTSVGYFGEKERSGSNPRRKYWEASWNGPGISVRGFL